MFEMGVYVFSDSYSGLFLNLYKRYRIETGFAGMNAAHYLHCELSRGVGIPQKQNVMVESLSRKVHCTLQ